jgi:uncharacterized flavoprotein (TIGR03862 family)
MKTRIAIVGSGPAGLMAATVLSESMRADLEIFLFEKRAGLGRKLLIAGSSGLNISHDCTPREFAEHYTRNHSEWPLQRWEEIFKAYGPELWVQFIEEELEMETFVGTSQRYFVREMKASGLLKRWTERLKQRGVTFVSGHELQAIECVGSDVSMSGARLKLSGEWKAFEQVVLALGGGSWENESPQWPKILNQIGVKTANFEASNVGFEVEWAPGFLKEAEGKPLKNITLKTSRGEKSGELMITSYGLEGTPMYFLGSAELVHLDLKPGLSLPEIKEKLTRVKENLSPLRRATKTLNLSEEALALIFHHAPAAVKSDLNAFAEILKNFPVQLKQPRPLSEAISSRGGVKLSEVTPALALKICPQIYCTGEMLDWDAPTGGFLIQGAVSTAHWAATEILKRLPPV